MSKSSLNCKYFFTKSFGYTVRLYFTSYQHSTSLLIERDMYLMDC